MHCPNCGNPIEDDDLFCGECGHKISRHPQSVRNAESEITKAEKNDEEQNITSNNKENNAATHQNVDSTSHDETRSNENDVADSTLQLSSHIMIPNNQISLHTIKDLNIEKFLKINTITINSKVK